MYALSFVLLALPLAGAIAPTLGSHFTVHESRGVAPPGFVKVGPAPPNKMLILRLGLVQNDATSLEERLIDISTPSSANYGKFLSKEEVFSAASAMGHRLIQYRSKPWLHQSKKRLTPSTRFSQQTEYPPRLTVQLETLSRSRSPFNKPMPSLPRSSTSSEM